MVNAIDITYNFADPATSKNAGHVYGITNNLSSGRSQAFTYDQVNRIASAGTTATTGSTCWGYKYSFDAWGNLLSQVGWTPTYNACTESTMSGVTADGNNHISGLSYDTAGNTLSDGNYSYTWDGESQLKTAGGVTYTYDGDGRRAAKSGSKLYWYGSGGEILAETDAAGNTQNEYVYFGGKRIALVPAAGNPLYYAEDLLGSSRVMVQSNGTVCYDADFTPFGGEKAITSTCAQNYKFEGKERDAETQNDDFGAREYSWRYGRWLSSDWSAVPVAVPYANLTNPQTLNLYSMVADDPESFADLDGHQEPAANAGLVPPGVPASCANDKILCQAQQTPPSAQNTPEQSGSEINTNPPTPDPAGVRNADPMQSSDTQRNNSPAQGDADTTITIPKPGGNSTDRTFGPDGRAVKDIDKGHDHGAGDPHAHDWDWNKKPARQPGRPLTPEETANLKKAGTTATVGVIIYWVVSEGSRLFPPRNLIPVP